MSLVPKLPLMSAPPSCSFSLCLAPSHAFTSLPTYRAPFLCFFFFLCVFFFNSRARTGQHLLPGRLRDNHASVASVLHHHVRDLGEEGHERFRIVRLEDPGDLLVAQLRAFDVDPLAVVAVELIRHLTEWAMLKDELSLCPRGSLCGIDVRSMRGRVRRHDQLFASGDRKVAGIAYIRVRARIMAGKHGDFAFNNRHGSDAWTPIDIELRAHRPHRRPARGDIEGTRRIMRDLK